MVSVGGVLAWAFVLGTGRARGGHFSPRFPTFPSFQNLHGFAPSPHFDVYAQSYGAQRAYPTPPPAAPYAPKPYGQIQYGPAPAYPAPAPSYPAPAYPAPAPSYPSPAPSYPAPAPAPTYPAPAPAAQGTVCYKVYKDCAVANIHPFERRSYFSQQQCQDLCQSYSNRCQSFVFDNTNQVCDLYAVTGNQYPAAFFKAPGRDYYEKISNCAVAGPSSGGSYGGGTAPGPGTPTGGQDSCSPRVTRYLRIEGFELTGNDDRVIDGSLAACTDACTIDASCVSFDYVDNQCLLTSEAAVPTGSGQLVERTGSEYYEKICLDTQTSTNCPTVFNRVPQFTLVGFAEEVVTANSFEECLNECVNARTNLGITCRSGMYYFEVDTENCILNVEDRSTQPALFVEETEDIVDYFETGCGTTTIGTPGTIPYTGGSVNPSPYQPPTANRPYSLRRSLVTTEPQEETKARESLSGPPLRPNTRARESLNGLQSSFKRRSFAPGGTGWSDWTPCDARFNGRRYRYRHCAKPLLTLCPSQKQECNTSVFSSRRGTDLNQDPRTSERIVHRPENDVFLPVLKPRLVPPPRRDPAPSNHSAPAISQDRGVLKVRVKCAVGKCCPVAEGICLVGVLRSPEGQVSWCSDPC